MKLQPSTYLREPCVVIREDGSEASVAVRGLSSTERGNIRVAEAFLRVEGNMDTLAMVREYQARGVEEPMDVRTCLVGTWEAFISPCCRAGPQWEGACSKAGDGRDEGVRYSHSSDEGCEQRGEIPGGAAGAKDCTQGETRKSTHVPSAELGARVTGDGLVTAMREAEPTGTPHDALTSCQCRLPSGRILRA